MADQTQIGFENVGLGEVLKRYHLRVPPNQRDYAWEEEQVRTLFEDIAYAISQDQGDYFLGTIVTVPKEDGILEVIDGQQRLATTSLALSTMKHLAEKGMEPLAKALEQFLESSDSKTLEVRPKMTLNTSDTGIFHSLIIEGKPGESYVPERSSHVNLVQARKIATTYWLQLVKPYDENNRIDVLKRWMNFIEYRAKVILLKVPSTVNAFKMFETLNDRGLKATQADLVKNYILGEAGGQLEQAQEKWSYIKGSLETIGEEEITVNFLRQALICQNGYMRESEVFEKVREKVKGENSANTFLNTTEVLARDYSAMFNSAAPKWTGYPTPAKRALNVLRMFDTKPFRPLLLAIGHRFDEKQATAAFQGLVSLGVRLIIASSTRSGSVEQPLANAARAVFAEETTTSKSLFKALEGIVPTNKVFEERFSVATVSNARLARYYLRSLEVSAAGEAEPWFIPNEDPTAITLEHVLPLRTEGNWNHIEPEVAKAYAKRIGNLALLQATGNSDLKSDSFDVKKPVLASSAYETTARIANWDSWDASAITERQNELAKLAVTTWPQPRTFG